MQAKDKLALDSNMDSGSDGDLESKPTMEEVKGKGKEKVEWSIKPRKDIPKRNNKNAYVSSVFYFKPNK